MARRAGMAMLRYAASLASILWVFVSPGLCAASPYPRPAKPDVPTYAITIDLRPPNGHALIEGTVDVPVGARALPELVLSVNKAFRSVRFTVVDPRPADNPVVASEHGGFTDYRLKPRRPFAAGSVVVVRFSYEFDPAVPVSYFHAGHDGAFASGINVAWYPQVQTPAPRPDGIGRLEFRLPAGATVAVNGAQAGADRARTAASASFSFLQPTAFSFAAGVYQVHTAGNDPQVKVLQLSRRANAGDYARDVRKIIDFYGKEFGPFPFDSFAVVEVPESAALRSGFSGQSEDGMIWVTPRYLQRRFSFAYYGHEIGHQWWGQLVRKRLDSDSGLYMPDEAVAQWGSLQVVAAFEGDAAAERYRRTGYPGYVSLQNGLGYLSMVAAGVDEVIDGHRRPTSHRLANSKGFLVLDHLADLIGRDRFRDALRQFVREHAFDSASWPQLKHALQAATPQDLSWFMEQWFARPGAPDWSLEWHQAGNTVSGVVTQPVPYYRATVEVSVSGEACGQRIRQLEIQGPRTPFQFDAPCMVQSVLLDPHYRVLHWTPEYHALARAHVPYARWVISDSYPQIFDELHGLLQANATTTPDVFGVDFALHYDLAKVHLYDGHWPEAMAALNAALMSATRPPDELPGVFADLALAASKVGDTKAMQRAALAAQAADTRASAPTGATERVLELIEPSGN